MLGCLNCNYANTDCPLTRRIDNSAALAATARYRYGYLTTFEYAWENAGKFIIGFTLTVWKLCIHYGIGIWRNGPQMIINGDEEWKNTYEEILWYEEIIDIFSKWVCIGCWLISLIVPGTAKQSKCYCLCYYCCPRFWVRLGGLLSAGTRISKYSRSRARCVQCNPVQCTRSLQHPRILHTPVLSPPTGGGNLTFSG